MCETNSEYAPRLLQWALNWCAQREEFATGIEFIQISVHHKMENNDLIKLSFSIADIVKQMHKSIVSNQTQLLN